MKKSIRLNDATPADWNKLQLDCPPIEAQRSGLEHWQKRDKEPKESEDLVNSPSHYNSGGIEAIEAIQASMSTEAFKGYCKANCIKYLWRMDYKGKTLEDAKKSRWYLERLISVLEVDS